MDEDEFEKSDAKGDHKEDNKEDEVWLIIR